MNLTTNLQSLASIEGYASIYNTPDMNGDIIDENAFQNFFSKNLSNTPSTRLMMLYQHKVDCPIGRWVDVKHDKKGLYVKGELLLDSPKAKEIYALLKGRALDGLSIGFRTVKARKSRLAKRIIEEAELWEVSIVSFPMAPSARITFVGDAEQVLPVNPERAGIGTQPARRAPVSPSGARHTFPPSQFSKVLRSATNILSQS